ncbi:MAG: hypothetical protein RL272_1128 [Candidatus Parcubacteria bacterium]
MPGDRNKPIDGKTMVKYGDMTAEGKIAGLTVAQVRELVARETPELGLPADAAARVVTMDDQEETWQKIAAAQEGSLVTRRTGWGVQMYQGVAKDVPDDYVIRKADIFLEFRDRD